MRQTHTYAEMNVSPAAHNEIKVKLEQAGYAHLIDEGRLCLEGIALVPDEGEHLQPPLTVWYGAMPESNGKSNFTAIVYPKGGDIVDGITLDRSEYPDRVRYEADRMRYLLGELKERPHILNYEADVCSDYLRINRHAEPDYKALYHELLYCVGNVTPGETRHQTARRYLLAAESNASTGCEANGA